MDNSAKCQLEIPSVQGLEPAQLTVGRHALLKCEGEWDKIFDFTKAQFILDEKQPYAIKVLKAEARDLNHFDLDIVFHQAGQFQWPQLLITDGAQQVNLGSQRFMVQSVLKPGPDGKPPEAFGSVLPLSLEWPIFYFLILLSLLCVSAISAVLYGRYRMKMKKLIDSLKKYESNIDPDLQFYRSIRQLEKQQYPLPELEKAFSLYVTRTFQVPAFDLTPAQLYRFIKKFRPEFVQLRPALKRIYSEFETLKNDHDSIEHRQDLLKKMYRFVDVEGRLP